MVVRSLAYRLPVDPLIAALELRQPVDAVVMQVAIDYRRSLIRGLQQEILALQETRARLLNEDLG